MFLNNVGPRARTKLRRGAFILHDVVRAAEAEDMLGAVPVFGHADEARHREVDGGHMYTVEEAGRVGAGRSLVEEGRSVFETLLEGARAKEHVRLLGVGRRGSSMNGLLGEGEADRQAWVQDQLMIVF